MKVDKDVDLALLGPLGCGIQTGAGSILNVLKPEFRSSLVVYGTGAGKIVSGVVEGDSEPHTFIPKLIAYYKKFDCLVEFYPLEKINEAFEASKNGSVIKPIIKMD